MINWKVRIKNKTFWLSLIPALLLLAQALGAVFGLSLDLSAVGEKLLTVVNTLFAVLTIRCLAAVCGPAEALRRFSCEIEHDEENLSALRDGFWAQEELSPAHVYAELG